MKKRTRIGLWNVRTLNKETDKLAQAEENMLNYHLLFLGMTEVRWNGFGEAKAPKGSTLLFSGKENEDDTHEYGVGLLLSKEAKKSLLDWKPISDRILTARFHSRVRKITVVICYSPTETSCNQDKEDFYDHLNKTMNGIKRQDIVILMGDMNARIGSDNTNFEKCMGKHALGVQNENGKLFAQFCLNYNLVIGGSLFPHKDCHKYTWNHPNGISRNQIDHIAISAQWRSSLLDVRNRRGADIDSDHELVIGQLRMKVAAPAHPSGRNVGRKFDVSKLKSLELQNRFAALEQADQDIDKGWLEFKNAYTMTSEAVLGHSNHKREDWMSVETWDLIEQRRNLKVQLCAAVEETHRDTLKSKYKTLRKRIYRSCRRDMRIWADNVADRAQLAANSGNMRELYRATKILAGNKKPRKRPLRSKTGEVITSSEGQLQRWFEHFTEVYHVTQTAETNTTDASTLSSSTPRDTLAIDTDAPSSAEVLEAIKQLKGGKAPGADLITAEMLKSDLSTATAMLTPLIQTIWEKESLPEEWTKGLLIAVPKKGDLSNCNNWRGITLMSTPSKVLSRIILNRLSKVVEPLLRNEQAGFRPNRSCVDQINTLRIIFEQAAEFQREIYSVFVDFEKAFDTLQWQAIWNCLNKIGVPNKISNLIKAAYNQYSCRVRHDNLLSEDIYVKSGVRQGCLMSPILFLVVLDHVMSRVNVHKQRGIEWGLTEHLQDLDYADDLCLLSHRCADMQMKLDDLQREAANVGLKINVGKTKDLRTGTTIDTPLKVNGQAVEKVTEFTYLGSVVSGTGGTEMDVTSRIAKAKGAFACLRPVWKSKHLSTRVKLKIFNTNVKSILLYGCETWKTTVDLTQELQVFINRCLRQIMHIFWPDAVMTNKDLWKLCGEEPVEIQIRRRKWNWIGHTLRRPSNHIPRQALQWNPQGKRKVGRPKSTWRRTAIKEAEKIGLTWSEVKRAASDRTGWRKIVSALCPNRGT